MKYVIYLRVSTEQQSESGLGMEAQKQMCLSYILRVVEFENFKQQEACCDLAQCIGSCR